MFKEPSGNCMSGLVVGNGSFFLRLEDIGSLLQTSDNSFNGSLEMFMADGGGQFTSSDQSFKNNVFIFC